MNKTAHANLQINVFRGNEKNECTVSASNALLVYMKQWIAVQKFVNCPLANYHIVGLGIHTATLTILALAHGMLAQKSLLQS